MIMLEKPCDKFDRKFGGVFWLIEEELLIIPYFEGAEAGLAKSGENYNHRLLWHHVRPKGCNKEFDYYPRGRVEIDKRGRAVIFMSPYIEKPMFPRLWMLWALLNLAGCIMMAVNTINVILTNENIGTIIVKDMSRLERNLM